MALSENLLIIADMASSLSMISLEPAALVGSLNFWPLLSKRADLVEKVENSDFPMSLNAKV